MTKDEKKEYDRKRYLENKSSIDERQRLYRLANLEKVRIKDENYRNSMKDGLYTLYYLKEEHYVGITDSVKRRMRVHKSLGKYTEDVEVICKFKTKREALDAEGLLHSVGYNGKNKHYTR